MRVVTERWMREWSTTEGFGTWNRAQLAILGIAWDGRRKGWVSSVIGQVLSDAEALRFEALSGRYDEVNSPKVA